MTDATVKLGFDDNKEWYDNYFDLVDIRELLPPYSNICFGSHPTHGMKLKTAQRFDAFINYSRTDRYSDDVKKPRKDTEFYRIPIEEMKPWGYSPFFQTKYILDYLHANKKQVFMHCFAGQNRSPSMAVAWLLSREHSLDEACSIVMGGNQELAKARKNRFLFNIDKGFIPGKLDEFYARYKEVGPDLEKIVSLPPRLE